MDSCLITVCKPFLFVKQFILQQRRLTKKDTSIFFYYLAFRPLNGQHGQNILSAIYGSKSPKLNLKQKKLADLLAPHE